MNKVKLLFITAAVFGITACNFQVPEKISVKTNADYNFNVGTISKSFEDTISFTDVLSDDKIGIENAHVYDYFPGEADANVQQYLFKLPLMEIPVDISKYYNNSGVASAIQGMSFEKEIEIPTVKVENTTDADVSTINNVINTAFSFGGVAAPGDGTATFGATFESITYKTGTIVVEMIPELSGTAADGATVTLAGSKSGTFQAGKAIINIDNFTITPGMKITFSSGVYGTFKGTISNGSKIKEAKGVTYANLAPMALSSSTTLPDKFVSATVGQGALDTAININWPGTTVSYNVATTGALNASGTGSINLAGKTITPGTVNINASVTLVFNNATINFDKNPTIDVKTNIQQFTEVTINASDITTNVNKEDEFTSALLDSVKKIKIVSSGLKGTYTNTFPAGNDIKVIGNSQFFGITNGASTLESGKTDAEFTPIMSPSGFSSEITPVPIANHDPSNGKYGKWDFAVDVQFQGSTPGCITVRNVKPEEKYKIAINFTPELNWEYVDIIPPSNTNNADTKSLGVSFASLFTSVNDTLGFDFGSKIEIDSIPVYIRAEKPDVGNSFNNLNFTGNVKLFYGKDDGAGNITVLKKDGANIEKNIISGGTQIQFVPGIPEMEMKDKSLITDISSYRYSVKEDLADILNKTLDLSEGELYVDYDVGLAGGDGNAIRITKDQCEGDASGSICVNAFIILPMKFKVKSGDDPLLIEFQKLIGNDGSDLFGRSEASSVMGEDLDDYTSVINSCGFKYAAKKLPFYSRDCLYLQFGIFSDSTPQLCDISKGEITVTGENIRKMMSGDSYPYAPVANIYLKPHGVFSLARTLDVEMNITLKLSTDGTVTVMGGNK